MADKELMEQLQLLIGMIEKLPTEERVREMIDEKAEAISDRSASKAAALVEEKLGKRIDSLFDGYKLTHEKQYELERRVEKLEQIILEIQSKIA